MKFNELNRFCFTSASNIPIGVASLFLYYYFFFFHILFGKVNRKQKYDLITVYKMNLIDCEIAQWTCSFAQFLLRYFHLFNVKLFINLTPFYAIFCLFIVVVVSPKTIVDFYGSNGSSFGALFFFFLFIIYITTQLWLSSNVSRFVPKFHVKNFVLIFETYSSKCVGIFFRSGSNTNFIAKHGTLVSFCAKIHCMALMVNIHHTEQHATI